RIFRTGLAFRTLLAGQDALHAALRLGEPFAAALDDVAHRVEREEGALLLLFLEDDLRERDRRQIFFCFVVYDFYVIAIPDHLADLIERDVPAVLGIVELAIGVALDDPGFGHYALLNDSKVITHRAIPSTCHTESMGPDLII